MSHPSQPPLDPEVPAEPKPKRWTPGFIPFDTHLTVTSPLRLVEGGVELQIDGQTVLAELHPQLVQKIQEAPPEPDTIYTAVLWFRLIGGEVQALILARFSPARGEKAKQVKPVFRISARLMDVSVKQGVMLLQVEPNAKGTLSAPFLVCVRGRKPMLKSLPDRHRTVVAIGAYEPTTGHLVATSFSSWLVGPPEGDETLPIQNASVRLAPDPEPQLIPDAATAQVQPKTGTAGTAAQPPVKPRTPSAVPAHAKAEGGETAKPRRTRAPKT